MRAAIDALELEMTFPFARCERFAKTHWLAGYAALQHFAWDVMNVMTFEVGLRELYVDVKQGVKMRGCITRLTRGTSYCHQVGSRREIYTY